MGLKGIMLNEKKKKASYVLYDSIYRTGSKWQNYRYGRQISGCQGDDEWEEVGVIMKG